MKTTTNTNFIDDWNQPLTRAQKSSMDIKDIAKAVRIRLQETIPQCKFSVTIERYSMGRSLNINLMSGPFEAEIESVRDGYPRRDITKEAQAVLDQAKAVAEYFNFDESDIQSDYFCVNFYCHVGVGNWPKRYQMIKVESPENARVQYYRTSNKNFILAVDRKRVSGWFVSMRDLNRYVKESGLPRAVEVEYSSVCKWIEAPDLTKLPVNEIFPAAAKDVQEGNCPGCKNPIGQFRNAISRKEYSISGLCQKCQDSVFGKD